MRSFHRLFLLGFLIAGLLGILQPAAAADLPVGWHAEPLLLADGRFLPGVELAPIDATHIWARSYDRMMFFDGLRWQIQ